MQHTFCDVSNDGAAGRDAGGPVAARAPWPGRDAAARPGGVTETRDPGRLGRAPLMPGSSHRGARHLSRANKHVPQRRAGGGGARQTPARGNPRVGGRAKGSADVRVGDSADVTAPEARSVRIEISDRARQSRGGSSRGVIKL